MNYMMHLMNYMMLNPYELWKNRKPNISYFHAFGSKCFVHNNGKESIGNFDAKSDEGIFLRYSSISKAYRVFNKKLKKVEKSIHVIFDETNHFVLSLDNDNDNPGI